MVLALKISLTILGTEFLTKENSKRRKILKSQKIRVCKLQAVISNICIFLPGNLFPVFEYIKMF